MRVNNIFVNEFLRLWKKPGMITSLIVSCFAVIIGLKAISSNNWKDPIPKEYREAFIEFDGINIEQIYDICLREYPSSMDFTSKARLFRQLKEEIEQQMGYGDYLDSIIRNAEITNSISIFANEDSFAYKNAKETAEVYSGLKEKISISTGPSKGIELWSGNTFSWFIIVLVILVAVSELTVKDRESGQLTLLFTLKNGRKIHCITKIGVCFLSSFLVTIFVELASLITMANTYGLGDLFRSVQSICGLKGCPLKLSVAEYILVYCLFVSMAAFLISVIFFFIASIPLRGLGTYFILTVVIGVETALFLNISETSYLSILKELNLVSFIYTHRYLSVFENVNLFGYPVWRLIFVGAAMIIGLGGMIPLTINAYTRQPPIPVRKKMSISIRIPDFLRPKHINIVKHELYKLLICGGTGLVLIIYTGFTFTKYTPEAELFENEASFYYKEYAIKYEGTITEKKINDIENERKRYEALQNEMNEAIMNSPSELINIITESYSDKLKKRAGLELLVMKLDEIKTSGGYILYDMGYRLLTFDKKALHKELILYMMSSIMLVLSLSYLFAGDDQIQMDRITSVCINGRKKLRGKKIFIGAIVILMIWCITYIPYYAGVLNTYGYMGLDYPIQSVENLRNSLLSDIKMSIGELLIIINVGKIFLLLSELLVVNVISRKIRSFSRTVVAGLCIFVGPVLMGYLLV